MAAYYNEIDPFAAAWLRELIKAGHIAPGEVDERSIADGHWRNADWLFCRDGKWRPVSAGTFPLAHGAPARVVCVCPNCKAETVIYEGLYFLRKINRGHEGLETQEVLLRRVLFFISAINEINKREYRALQGESEEKEDCLRDLRERGEFTHPSQRCESAKRCDKQSSSALLSMSSPDALEGAAFSVRRLWKEVQSRVAPTSEEQNMFCPVCERMGPHKCQKEVGKNRIGRLRGYGNAICAPQAEEFIRAYMEVTE